MKKSGITEISSTVVTNIGESAFSKCASLLSADFCNATYVQSGAFTASGIVSANFPKLSMMTSCFNNCANLSEITLADEVYIENGSFGKCPSIKSFKNTVFRTSGSGAINDTFKDCSSLETISVCGDNVIINENTFVGCAALKEVTVTAIYGKIISSAFDLAATFALRLDVGETFAFDGKVPDNVTVYVPYLLREKFLSEWLITDPDKLIAFDFGTDLQYLETEDGYVVKGLGSVKSAQIVIPSEYKGKPVVSIASSAFANRNHLTSVTVCGVKQIGAYAFAGCAKLSNVTFESGVISVGDYAFYNCNALETINFSDTLESVGQSAFYNCPVLKAVELPDSIKSIGDYCFHSCFKITSVRIGKNLKTLGNYSFFNCYSLESVYFNAVSCDAIDHISIVFGVYNTQQFGYYDLVIGKDVEKIPDYCFRGTTGQTRSNIDSLTFEQGSVCREIGVCAFVFSDISSVVLPPSLQKIGESAFYFTTRLNKVELSENITEIGTIAFGVNSSTKPNLTLRVAAAEKPAGWAIGWAQNVVEIVWNAKSE